MFDSIGKEGDSQNLQSSDSLEVVEETSHAVKEAEELQNSNLNEKSIGSKRGHEESSSSGTITIS